MTASDLHKCLSGVPISIRVLPQRDRMPVPHRTRAGKTCVRYVLSFFSYLLERKYIRTIFNGDSRNHGTYMHGRRLHFCQLVPTIWGRLLSKEESRYAFGPFFYTRFGPSHHPCASRNSEESKTRRGLRGAQSEVYVISLARDIERGVKLLLDLKLLGTWTPLRSISLLGNSALLTPSLRVWWV